jgi:hypothetical protein
MWNRLIKFPQVAVTITFIDDLFVGFAYYVLTGMVVLLGVFFGSDAVIHRGAARKPPDLVSDCVRFDGWQYHSIAQNGYEYDPAKRSTVAFFPAYPLLTSGLSSVSGLRIQDSLLIVSNAFLVLSFGLLACYARLKADPEWPAQIGWTLLAFGVWPSAFFLRMALAKSVFMAAALAVLIGVCRGWPLLLTAAFAGMATAARPVGVAVPAAFLWHVLFSGVEPVRVRLIRAVFLVPVACWGLLAYMGYQYAEFGNAFAFAQTQENWTHQAPVKYPLLAEKAWALATFEPVRGVFDSNSPRYWHRSNGDDAVIFNLFFWNPVLFMAAGGLVAIGAWRKWLSGPEIVLGAGLLAIPYLTRSYEMSMASHARFAAAVVVIYPVLGRILASWPAAAAAAACGLSAAIMMCWTALYVSGHPLF